MKHILLSGNTAWSMYNFRSSVIKSLLEAGYTTTIVAPTDGIFDKMIEKLGANFINIDIDGKGTNPIKDFNLIRQYKSIFKKESPDFIFLFTIKPNIYGSLAAKSCKIPHIAITTGLGYTFMNNNIVTKIVHILYKIAFLSPLEVWFLNNDDLKTFINHKLIDSQKGFILKGEGINLKKFYPTCNQSEEISFLLIARMLWDKGIDEYVKSARLLKQKYPEVKFNLLGFIGSNNPSAISEKQITIWEEEGIIKYLGSTKDVKPFIEAHSCIVLPSYREGIPVTLLEASSMCKPIVTTDSIGCKDVIDDGITGYKCKIKDVDSLTQAMIKIIKMPPYERQKMGEAGRKKMEQEFDEQLIIGKYLSVIIKYLHKY